MKSKKKLLLTGIAAMSLLALGVGATSTFAWFQTSTAATVSKSGATGSVAITENAGSEITMNATIHLVFEDPSNASFPLTTWTKTGEEVSNSLYTGAYAAGATYADARLTKLATQTDGYATIKVSAWIEDTSSSGEKAAEGHTVAWRAAINALTTASDYTKEFTFAYDDEAAVGEGNTRLLEADTAFYYAAKASGAADAISESAEKTSPVKAVSVNAKTLLENYEDDSHLLQLGYLYVRAEGGLRAHTNGANYKITLKVS